MRGRPQVIGEECAQSSLQLCSTLERFAAEQLVTVNLQKFTLQVLLRLSIE